MAAPAMARIRADFILNLGLRWRLMCGSSDLSLSHETDDDKSSKIHRKRGEEGLLILS
jgi:hypothetical protein